MKTNLKVDSLFTDPLSVWLDLPRDRPFFLSYRYSAGNPDAALLGFTPITCALLFKWDMFPLSLPTRIE